MKRSANILIKEVHNNSNKVLEKARVVLLLDAKISSPIELTKNDIIFLIEDGDIVKTVYKDSNATNWTIGANINIVNVNGNKYLRTDSNNTAQDNLDKLPTY